MTYRDIEDDGASEEIAAPPAPPRPRAPRRMTAGVVVFVLLLVGVGALRVAKALGDEEPRPEQPSAVVQSSSPTRATEPEPTTSSTPTPTEVPQADEAGALRTAKLFLGEWAQPDRPKTAWQERTKRYATEAFSQSLSTVEPGNVPATRINRVTVDEVNLTAARIRATTDGPTVLVFVRREGDRWRVSGIEPVSDQVETEDH